MKKNPVTEVTGSTILDLRF